MKKLSIIIPVLFSFISFYTGNRLASLCIRERDAPIVTKIIDGMDSFVPSIKATPLYIDKSQSALMAGIVFTLCFLMFFSYTVLNRKNYRRGIEHGSARWGTIDDIKPYIDRVFKNNILFSQTERLTMESRPRRVKYARNKNVIIVGGSGSGKTRFEMMPNLMQMHSSYVVTDPKGTILPDCGKMLRENGYNVRSLNLIDFSKSLKYNPFAYIRSEKDILKFVNTIISNCNAGKKEDQKEDFWTGAERLLLTALIAYVWYEGLEEERHIGTVLDILDTAEVRENDDTFQSPMDLLFEDLKEQEPNHFAVKQYNKFKTAAGETLKSILISVGVRLAAFDIKEVRDLMTGYDQMELDKLGDEKSALFVIIPDSDTTYNFIAAIMYTQLFNTLIYKADNEYGGRLPFHVRCMLDEFANIGQIPDFQILIATIRSREISATIILQTLSQLKGLYKDHAETISGNCDTFVFLGGKETKTLEDVSKMLGKETIDNANINKTRGRELSSSEQNQILGRELLTLDELSVMEGDECIVSIRGCRPFKSKKYDIMEHPNYKMLADYDKANKFDIRETQGPSDVTDDFSFDFIGCDIKEIVLDAAVPDGAGAN